MAPPPSAQGDDYTVDDLVADERRQSRFTAVIFVLAILYFGGKGLLGGAEPPPAGSPGSAAPLASSTH